MRGRPATPTAILALRGSRRAKGRAGEINPPGSTQLAAPAWLDAAGQAHWDATAPRLRALGLLTEADVPVWSRACALWSRLEALRALIAQDGLVLIAENGQGRLHPALKLELLVLAEYAKLAGQFGMTPRGRVGMNADPSAVTSSALAPGVRHTKDKERFFRT